MQNILIVDDNRDNRQVIRLVLESMNYNSVETENGRGAIEALEKNPFHLIFLDLEMPEVRGDEVLKRVRNSPEWKSIPVVVITANHHMLGEEIEDKADYVLLKPIDVLQLKQLITRIFVSKEAAS
jgi:CheY-like chemotaxis protein